MRIRDATPDDFETVAALLVELGGARPPLPEDATSRARVRRVYDEHLARARAGRGLVLLAEEDGRAVGLLTGDVRERLNHATPEVWLADVVVTQAARGQGVGKALLARAVAFARGLGAHRICLESGHWRQDAHRFYKREGWSDVGLHFQLALA